MMEKLNKGRIIKNQKTLKIISALAMLTLLLFGYQNCMQVEPNQKRTKAGQDGSSNSNPASENETKQLTLTTIHGLPSQFISLEQIETSLTVNLVFDSVKTDERSMVFVHVYDENNQLVVNSDHWPSVDTDQWQGRVEYSHTIEFPEDGLPVGQYKIVTGLFLDDELAGWPRLDVLAGGSAIQLNPTDIQIATMNITTSDTTPSSTYSGGTQVNKLSNLPGNIEAGNSLEIVLDFDSENLDQNYRVFLHLLDQSDSIIVNGDHLPPLETSKWDGKIRYKVKVNIPDYVIGGKHRFVVGLFNSRNDRPKLTAGPGVKEGYRNSYEIGSINIKEKEYKPTDFDNLKPSVGVVTNTVTNTKTPSAPSGYELYFSDEFDNKHNGAPNSSYWEYDIDYVRGTEKQCYTDNRRENVRVETRKIDNKENGYLVLELRRENYNCKQNNNKTYRYTSGSIHTRRRGYKEYLVDMPHGRYEVRAKIPSGRGTWPAIWLYGTGPLGSWPESGEIDIMEAVGFDEDEGNYRFYTTLHRVSSIGWNGAKTTGHSAVFSLNEPPSARFHTWVMEWTPDSFEFFIDGKRVMIDGKNKFNRHDFNGGDNPLAWPFSREVDGTKFKLLLNLAFGGVWGGQRGLDESIFDSGKRVEFLVDYVRVYKKK